jgi:transposase-like protein
LIRFVTVDQAGVSDGNWLVEHRLRAVLEVRGGARVVEVAARYGALRQSVYGWKAAMSATGRWSAG